MELATVKENLEKKGYKAEIFENVEDAKAYLSNSLNGKTIGMGGSVTIKEMGLFQTLNQNNQVWWHNDQNELEEYGDKLIRKNEQNSSIYISSVNAMSKNGEIVNIDHTGNRISSICYGHEKTYLIIGKNKICDDLDKAIWRARNVAAPKNAQRLHKRTPCAIKGDKCYDCESPDRICRGFLIMERAFDGSNTEVILINEDLGY